MTKVIRVGVKFGVDKPAESSYKVYYGARTASTKLYYYKAFESLELAVDDLVCVHTPTHGFTIAKVVSVDHFPEDSYAGYKWIVDKVDWRAHKARQEADVERALIQKQLDSKVDQARRRLEVADLLKDDSEAEKLLERLVQLNKLTG